VTLPCATDLRAAPPRATHARRTSSRSAPFRAGVAVLAALLVAMAAGCRADRVASSALPTRDAPVVLFFGDSITRGQGLPESQAFPAVVERSLAEQGLDFRCINAGVSGDTTQSALARLPKYAEAHPEVVVVELGANDGWRGVNRLRTRENLLQIIRAFSGAGASVILVGTRFPHLQHPAYALALDRLYAEVADATGVELIPDLMAGVAGVRELNLEDGLHPNAKGQQVLAKTALPAVQRAIERSR
jgi:acyl-CoA thioesterase-1